MTTTAGTAAAASEVVPDVAPDTAQPVDAPATTPAATPAADPGQQLAVAEAVDQAPAGPQMYKYKDHPLYKKYFYLASIGIPTPALQQQMRVNDIDPDIIDKDPEEFTDTPIPTEELA